MRRRNVYVLVSADLRHTYVGVSTDLDRRLAQHNGHLRGGAAATRKGRPWRLGATYGPVATRSDAQKMEAWVKKVRGRQRLDLQTRAMGSPKSRGRRTP